MIFLIIHVLAVDLWPPQSQRGHDMFLLQYFCDGAETTWGGAPPPLRLASWRQRPLQRLSVMMMLIFIHEEETCRFMFTWHRHAGCCCSHTLTHSTSSCIVTSIRCLCSSRTSCCRTRLTHKHRRRNLSRNKLYSKKVIWLNEPLK